MCCCKSSSRIQAPTFSSAPAFACLCLQVNSAAGALVQLPPDEPPAPNLTGGGAGDTLSSLVLTHYTSSLTASPVITLCPSATASLVVTSPAGDVSALAGHTGSVTAGSSRAYAGLGSTSGGDAGTTSGGDAGTTDTSHLHHQLGTFVPPFRVKDLAQLRGLDFAWQVSIVRLMMHGRPARP
jgi:hypothetical protein